MPEGIRVPVRDTRAAEGRLRPGGGDLLDVVGVLDAEQAEVVEQTGLAGGQLLRLGEFGEAQSPSPAARAMSLLMLVADRVQGPLLGPPLDADGAFAGGEELGQRGGELLQRHPGAGRKALVTSFDCP